MSANNFQTDQIKLSINRLESLQMRLRDAAEARKNSLSDRCASLQFGREADSILAWITDKEPLMSQSDYGRDLPTVQTLIARQTSFDSALVTFEVRIIALRTLRDELVLRKNSGIAAVNKVTSRNYPPLRTHIVFTCL